MSVVKGTRKYADDLAHYVLSGHHEEKNMVDCIKELEIKSKKEMREFAKEHIFFKAYATVHGTREANKELTQIFKDI